MRLLRSLAPLILVASLATACGSGSSSGPGASGSTTGTTSSGSLELRPVYARYATGVALGPAVPKDLQTAMASQSCPMEPAELQGMLMECDAAKTVFLLQAPVVSGGVTKADVQQIGHHDLYFLRLTLDPAAAATLDGKAPSMVGTELAFSFRGSVLTSVVVDSHFSSAHLALTGDFNKAQATRLATEITGS